MKIELTFKFDVRDEDVGFLKEAGWSAAQSQFTDQAEWEEYRQMTPHSPAAHDLIEIMLLQLWARDDLAFLELEDTESRTDG